MNKLRSVIRYICANYPHTHELSNARLTKMVYLADWEYARRCNKQITNIHWYFNNYGPFVDDVRLEAERDSEIRVLSTTNMYGMPKIQMQYIGEDKTSGLGNEEAAIIDSIMDETSTKYWNDFIRHVYSTYPIKNNSRYSFLDLEKLSKEERA